VGEVSAAVGFAASVGNAVVGALVVV